jgi:hypothetical protein
MLGFRAFRTALRLHFRLTDVAPEGIRTPNLLPYSPVTQGLGGSEWIRP